MESSPKTGSFAFCKEYSFINEQISGTCIKILSRVPVHQLLWYLSPDPLALPSSTLSAMKTSENKEGDPNDPEAADKKDIQMEHLSD
jgi:hypothetical protein